MVFLLFGNIYFLVFADKDIICYVAISNQLLVCTCKYREYSLQGVTYIPVIT